MVASGTLTGPLNTGQKYCDGLVRKKQQQHNSSGSAVESHHFYTDPSIYLSTKPIDHTETEALNITMTFIQSHIHLTLGVLVMPCDITVIDCHWFK